MRDSDELASAFVELEAFVRDSSRLPGLAAAQVEARRRRGRQIAWTAGAIVAVALAGVVTVPNWLLRSGPPLVDPSLTDSPTPSTSATSPTPSPSPTGPMPAAFLADLTPPERVRDAALDVPTFDLTGCPSGRLQFRDAAFSSAEGGVLMEFAAVGDVDADGLEDVVVALRCGYASGQHGIFGVQVLAYSGPALTLLGRVPNGDLVSVASLLVSPDGEVQLGMKQTGEVQSVAVGRYRWTGSGFEPIDNTAIPADALPRVVVSAEPATVRLAPGGPAEVVVVSVRNNGPTSALPVQLIVDWGAYDSIEIAIDGLASPVAESRQNVLIAPPPAGEAVTLTLRISASAGVPLLAESFLGVGVAGAYFDESDSDNFSIVVRPA